VLAEGYSESFPPVGVMIEVPSAVYLATALAERVDFLSVGSNDLTQYLLAVDRNNARVADLYQALHPAVLSALQAIVSAAHGAGKTVSICGELAGDPRAVPLLIAMGFDQLSMSATNVPRVKKVVQTITERDALGVLAKIQGLHSAEQVMAVLDELIHRYELDRFIRLDKGSRQ